MKYELLKALDLLYNFASHSFHYRSHITDLNFFRSCFEEDTVSFIRPLSVPEISWLEFQRMWRVTLNFSFFIAVLFIKQID